jgi:hypothetical protein
MKSNVVGALALVVIGTLFLLKNLGYTDMSMGKLLSEWWPAILIVVGLGMLFKRG